MSVELEAQFLPARMVNEFAYCPRLFHLEYVEGLFADNADTVDGRSVHRRVDAKDELLPDPPDGDPEPVVARSVTLSSTVLGVVAKIDLVEVEGGTAVPVDTKRGKAPEIPEGAWEPERVQVCLQGLLLAENGYACSYGFLYFAGSRRRVRIDFTEKLVARTKELVELARAASGAATPPPPLVDSPKCPRCSLVGICLPDEVNHLRRSDGVPDAPRRLVPGRDDLVPVHVQGYGLEVGKDGGNLVIREKGRVISEVNLKDLGHLSIYGNNRITAQAQRAVLEQGASISWFSLGGWFQGITRGMDERNVEMRRRQFRVADDEAARLPFARRFVAGKIQNSRTLLMRNHPEPPPEILAGLKKHARLAEEALSISTLLGIEGSAARLYFSEFAKLLKPREGEVVFDFEGRNRRPPKDPVNALLSFGYAVLCRETTAVLLGVGFDPLVGFLHEVRPGRPALALDLMEEFRPIVVDSVVITLINNREVLPSDFTTTNAGCAMNEGARKAFLAAYERRMDTLVTHPVFDYRVSYRRILEVQARLIGRVLEGDVEAYPPFTTR